MDTLMTHISVSLYYKINGYGEMYLSALSTFPGSVLPKNQIIKTA